MFELRGGKFLVAFLLILVKAIT